MNNKWHLLFINELLKECVALIVVASIDYFGSFQIFVKEVLLITFIHDTKLNMFANILKQTNKFHQSSLPNKEMRINFGTSLVMTSPSLGRM